MSLNEARPTTQQSRCMYCGSTTRGRGCRYAPHGVHFHPDDSRKCAYCGSTNYGRGCKINPTGDMHIHGINYNSMLNEKDVFSFLESKFLLKELKKPFIEFQAYKLNIIDEKGNKIKQPNTIEEQNSYTPFIKTIIKLKKYLGPKIDLIEAEENLTAECKLHLETKDKYKQQAAYKAEINQVINNLFNILESAAENGFSIEEIKELIVH